jgi:hypothetical protein
MAMIDRSIQLDLQRQQELLANKRTALAAKNTELGRMMERYDKDTAYSAAYAMKVDQYQRALGSVKSAGATAEANSAIDAMKVELGMKRDAAIEGFAQQRYKASLQAQGPSLSQILDIESKKLSLEGKALDNAAKRQEMSDGPKLLGEERKVQRSLGAVKPAYDRLTKWASKGDTPYLGVRSGTTIVPDALTPDENLSYRADVMQVAGQALRDDSGAVLGPHELSDKLDRLGVFAGSAERRQQGLRDLMYEYNARLQRGKLTPEQEAARRLSPGAAE